MLPDGDPQRALRLSDLRRAQPADATLKNLLEILTAKLELCARLPIFEHEADSDGHEPSARVLHQLAEVERESVSAVLACLREHIDASCRARQVAEGSRDPPDHPTLAEKRPTSCG